MFRKRTGRVQFLVLLRLWNGPPQNKQANKTNNSSEKKCLRYFWKQIASLVWYLLCGQVTQKDIAKNLSLCKILRTRCAVFLFLFGCIQKVGIIKCNFLQVGCSGWGRGSRASRSSTDPSSTSWRSLTGLRKNSFYLFQLWGFKNDF